MTGLALARHVSHRTTSSSQSPSAYSFISLLLLQFHVCIWSYEQIYHDVARWNVKPCGNQLMRSISHGSTIWHVSSVCIFYILYMYCILYHIQKKNVHSATATHGCPGGCRGRRFFCLWYSRLRLMWTHRAGAILSTLTDCPDYPELPTVAVKSLRPPMSESKIRL